LGMRGEYSPSSIHAVRIVSGPWEVVYAGSTQQTLDGNGPVVGHLRARAARHWCASIQRSPPPLCVCIVRAVEMMIALSSQVDTASLFSVSIKQTRRALLSAVIG
jgi:hypothetical protein